VQIDKVPDLIFLAIGTLILALATGVILTRRRAKQGNLKTWDYQAKRLVINLLIPLVTGGVLCVILIIKGYLILVAPFSLIFYGLALVNASRYTLDDIRSLGILEIILGLGASMWLGYGLWFWTVGFGLFHIIYGIHMYLKYEK